MQRNSSFCQPNLTLNNYSQSDANRHPSSTIFIVIPAGLTQENCSPRLISSKKLCVDYSLNAEWLTEEDLMNISPQPNNVYVLDPFEGTAYDYLAEQLFIIKKFMIIGPQCLKYGLLPHDTNAVESKGFPFYNVAMKDVCITLTGFDKELGAELTDLVQKMNGVVSKAYSVACTHVVARTTFTAKCIEAYKHDVLVMTEDWIRAVWKENQDDLVDATASKFIEYTCPIFHNVHICVSQTTSSMKAIMQNAITTNGGIYSKDFKRHVTDVLVIPCATGEKYKFARQWNVNCVTPKWIDECKQVGNIVSVDGFSPPKAPQEYLCSTQIDVQKSIKIPDFSNITACSAVVDLADNSRIDMINGTNYTETSRISVVPSNQKRKSSDVLLDDTLTTLLKAPEGFLDSSTIYLCEHNSGDLKIGEIRKILNSSGATRSDRITEKVSHVLVINGKILEQEIQTIKAIGHEPHIVTLEWLVESARQGSLANEERYAFEIAVASEQSVVTGKVSPPQQSIFKTITPSTSFNLTAVGKPKIHPRQEMILNNSRDFDSDLETPPPKHPKSLLFKTPVTRFSINNNKPDESPHFKTCLTKVASKQIKEALTVACEPSPGTSDVLNKSTPLKNVRNGFLDALELKTKRYKQNRIQETRNLRDIVSHTESIEISSMQDIPPPEAERRQANEGVLLEEVSSFNPGNRPTRSTENGNGVQETPPPPPQVERRQTRVSEINDEIQILPPPNTGRQTRNKQINSFQNTTSQVERRQTRQTNKSSAPSHSSSKASINNKRRDEKAKEPEDMAFKKLKSYVFSLSGCGVTEKNEAKNLIQELGGKVSSVDHYDKSAVAVIAYKVTRSEKILGAIAGGQPILNPRYLNACQEAQQFLEFEEFMWTEKEGSSESERNMARVAKKWYDIIRADHSKLPFANFRVFLADRRNKRKKHTNGLYQQVVGRFAQL